jgi:hypothetical protein
MAWRGTNSLRCFDAQNGHSAQPLLTHSDRTASSAGTGPGTTRWLASATNREADWLTRSRRSGCAAADGKPAAEARLPAAFPPGYLQRPGRASRRRLRTADGRQPPGRHDGRRLPRRRQYPPQAVARSQRKSVHVRRIARATNVALASGLVPSASSRSSRAAWLRASTRCHGRSRRSVRRPRLS